jgi:hypothetical protein
LEYIPGPHTRFKRRNHLKIDYFYMAKTNNDDNNSRDRNQSFNIYAKIRIRKDGALAAWSL